MQDLSNLVKGLTDAMVGDQFGDQEGNWGFADTDPDGGTTFENMDGDAAYPHSTSSANLSHDHYKH